MSREEVSSVSFDGLQIAEPLMERLQALGFEHPTPIQHQAILPAMEGKDIIGIAQTGTGKTLAFSLPLIQHAFKAKKIGLILLPTRELAVQVEETLKKVAGPLGLRTAILIGGVSINPQIRALTQRPQIIVATPGRLIDHLNQKTIRLDMVEMVVLDEADRMLDMGFKPQLERIMQTVPKTRQTLLFSATMPEEITRITREYMQHPVRIEVAPQGTAPDRVEQELFVVTKDQKREVLQRLLDDHKGLVIVFSRTKHGAKRIAIAVREMNHSVTEIHSNRSQNQRQDSLNGFSKGKYRVLVATDIAARGIDVKEIELVVNFDLPDQAEDYVHRIGRTGRAGHKGKAVSFATPDERHDVRKIERLLRTTLKTTVLAPAGAMSGADRSDSSDRPRYARRPHGGGSRSGGGFRGRGGSGGGGGSSQGGSSRGAPRRPREFYYR